MKREISKNTPKETIKETAKQKDAPIRVSSTESICFFTHFCTHCGKELQASYKLQTQFGPLLINVNGEIATDYCHFCSHEYDNYSKDHLEERICEWERGNKKIKSMADLNKSLEVALNPNIAGSIKKEDNEPWEKFYERYFRYKDSLKKQHEQQKAQQKIQQEQHRQKQPEQPDTAQYPTAKMTVAENGVVNVHDNVPAPVPVIVVREKKRPDNRHLIDKKY